MNQPARCSRAVSLALAATIIAGAALDGQDVNRPAAAKIASPVAPTPESLAAGKMAYDTNCAACHGDMAQGAQKAGVIISIIAEQGGKQPPDLTDDQWDHGSTDGEIFAVIKRGIPPTMMAGWEGRVSDTEIWSIVSYLRAFATKKPVTVAPAVAADPTAEHALALSDYVQLPMTGDPAGELTRGLLARVNPDEPAAARHAAREDPAHRAGPSRARGDEHRLRERALPHPQRQPLRVGRRRTQGDLGGRAAQSSSSGPDHLRTGPVNYRAGNPRFASSALTSGSRPRNWR
jgi:mono/diheme cytochrome c family protein